MMNGDGNVYGRHQRARRCWWSDTLDTSVCNRVHDATQFELDALAYWKPVRTYMYSAAAAHRIWWSDLLSVPAEIRRHGCRNRNITKNVKATFGRNRKYAASLKIYSFDFETEIETEIRSNITLDTGLAHYDDECNVKKRLDTLSSVHHGRDAIRHRHKWGAYLSIRYRRKKKRRKKEKKKE